MIKKLKLVEGLKSPWMEMNYKSRKNFVLGKQEDKHLLIEWETTVQTNLVIS